MKNVKVTFDDGVQKVIIDITDTDNGKSSVSIEFEPMVANAEDRVVSVAESMAHGYFNWLIGK